MRKRYLLGMAYPLVKLAARIFTRWQYRLVILTYHDIPQEKLDLFTRQINWLKRNYNVIGPGDLSGHFLDRSFKRGTLILITFDDGFRSSYHAALKTLDLHQIKAIFFLPTGFVERRNPTDWKQYIASCFHNIKLDPSTISDDKMPMLESDIKSLTNNGHAIGSHTVSHIDLGKIADYRRLSYEITDSKRKLEDITGMPVNFFAYPFGKIQNINPTSLKLVSTWYNYCFSNIRGSNYLSTSSYALRRQDIFPDYPLPYLGFIIEGGLNIRFLIKRRRLDSYTQNISFSI